MAKIYGQLEQAQLQNKTADPSAGVRGLVWWNTTTLKVMVDDGTNIRGLLRNDQQCIFGSSGTAGNNIRFQRAANAVFQLVIGSDVTAEGTSSTTLAQLSTKLEGLAAANKPAVGNAGRLLWITDSKTVQVDNGTTWVNVGGGGGGGSILWTVDEANAAEQVTEFSQQVYKFSSANAQKLRCTLVVPSSYVAGSPISMKIHHYSPSSSNTILLSATANLVRSGTDAFGSTTNARSTTNAALTNSVANQLRQATLDLTSTIGQINGVAVSAGDSIEVILTRGTDTDTADIRFVAGNTEVLFS
jgi:hypothetical protein